MDTVIQFAKTNDYKIIPFYKIDKGINDDKVDGDLVLLKEIIVKLLSESN